MIDYEELLNRAILDTWDDLKTHNIVVTMDFDRKPAILIRSGETTLDETAYHGDYLTIHFNSVHYEDDGTKTIYHAVSPKDYPRSFRDDFEVVFNYLFDAVKRPISKSELEKLLASLNVFLKAKPACSLVSYRLKLTGFLLVFIYFKKAGWTSTIRPEDLTSLDHLGPHLLVKITTGPKRLHRFSHEELTVNSTKRIVASVVLSPSPSSEGSLYGLFKEGIDLLDDDDADIYLALNQLMKEAGVDKENRGPRFNKEEALEALSFYRLEDTPHLDISNCPSAIDDISYRVNCQGLKTMAISEVLETIDEVGAPLSKTSSLNIA